MTYPTAARVFVCLALGCGVEAVRQARHIMRIYERSVISIIVDVVLERQAAPTRIGRFR